MTDILHDAVHGTGEPNLIFVIHGHANKQLRLAHCTPNLLTKLVSPLGEIVRVTGHGRVSHMRELPVVAPGQEAVQDGGDLALQDQFTVDQLHFFLGHLGVPDAATALLLGGRTVVHIRVDHFARGVVGILIFEVDLGHSVFLVGDDRRFTHEGT